MGELGCAVSPGQLSGDAGGSETTTHQESDEGEILDHEDTNLRLQTKQKTPSLAAEAILETAEAEHADLIVMGMRSDLHGLEKYFGRVSTVVANRARAPVLLVPPLAETRAEQYLG
jgi:nucleotide-binding universal stress UspA family protein